MSGCAVIQPNGERCGRQRDGVIIHKTPCPNGEHCVAPEYHHPYEEEPMPNPTVMIGTVITSCEPDEMDNRENHAKPTMALSFDRGTRLPRVGDRVAVAGTADAIFKWMETLPAKRIVDAARAWADMCDAMPGLSKPPRMIGEAQALYDAVRAAGAPSEDEAYEPPVIRDRKPRALATITIKITEDA